MSSIYICPGELNAVLYAELKKSVSFSSTVPASAWSIGSGELRLGRNRPKGSSLTAILDSQYFVGNGAVAAVNALGLSHLPGGQY